MTEILPLSLIVSHETGQEITLALQNARDVATSRVDAAVTSMLDKEARSLGPTSGGGESPEGQSSSPILGSQSRTPGGKPIGSKEEHRSKNASWLVAGQGETQDDLMCAMQPLLSELLAPEEGQDYYRC